MNFAYETLSQQTHSLTVRGSNHAGMRQFNERIVLQAVRQNAALPKADLARLTQLSTQTVAIIVDRLIADGLLLKHERIRGKIGQPSVPIALNPQGAYSVGIQVGRRGLEMMVCDFVGNTLHTWKHLYDYPSPQVVLSKVREGLLALEKTLANDWSQVVGIGLAAPLSMHQWADVLAQPIVQADQVTQASQVSTQDALEQWRHINLQQAIQALTPLPVEFAKDTTAACVAELLQGHGRTSRSFLYVFVGTFVGGGLVMGGHIVNGHRGNAGAIGSLPLGLGGQFSQSTLNANVVNSELESQVAATDKPGDKLNKNNQPSQSNQLNKPYKFNNLNRPNKPQQLLEVASGWQLEQTLIAAGLDPLLVHQESVMNPAYEAFTTPWLNHAALALAMTAASASALNDLDAIVIDGSLARSLMDALITQTQAAMSQYHFEGMHAPVVICGEVGRQARAKGAAWLPLHAQFFPDKAVFLKQDA